MANSQGLQFGEVTIKKATMSQYTIEVKGNDRRILVDDLAIQMYYGPEVLKLVSTLEIGREQQLFIL